MTTRHSRWSTDGGGGARDAATSGKDAGRGSDSASDGGKGRDGPDSGANGGIEAGAADAEVDSGGTTPADFGAKGDCATDDTAALQAFFDVGGILPVPSGGCYLVTNTIRVPSNVTVQGDGQAALITLVLPNRTPAVPVLDLSGSGLGTTSGISLANFAIDGGMSTAALAPPVVYGGAIQAGAAVLAQSGNTSLKQLWISNAWDNGIGVFRSDGASGQVNGQPVGVTVSGITCANNGAGSGGGGCVDVLTATAVSVSDSSDQGSYEGFIVYYAGGARATLTNLTADDSHLDGYYIGTPGNTATGLTSNRAGRNGMWIDVFAAGTGGTVTDFSASYPKRAGLLLDASGWAISQGVVTAANQEAQSYDAFDIDVVGIATGPITDVSLEGCSALVGPSGGATQRYGVAEDPGGYAVDAQIDGGTYQGAMGGYGPNVPHS